MYTVNKNLLNNVPSVIVETDKFKTITIQLVFRSISERERVTKRNLLSRMMIKRTDTFLKEADLLNYLAHHYGAHLTSNTGRKGRDHTVTIGMELVNDKFIYEDMDIVGEMCKLLNEVLRSPFNYDASDEDFFNKEKRLYRNRLKSMKDNRAQASFQAMVNLMFEEEDYKYFSFGVLEDVESLTLEDIKEEHARMMAEDALKILAVGAVDEDIEDKLNKIHKREALVELKHQPYPNKAIEQVKRETDAQKIEQAKLNMGFRVSDLDLQERMAFNVMNQMFGGSASSLLFQNIREKMSLAYQISSQIDVRNGYMFVMGGVDPKNVKKAESAILRELETLQQGEFDDEFVEEVKRMMRVNRKEVMDKPKGLLALEYNRMLQDEHSSSWEERLAAVDSAMIADVSKRVALDTVYVLTRSEEDEQN